MKLLQGRTWKLLEDLHNITEETLGHLHIRPFFNYPWQIWVSWFTSKEKWGLWMGLHCVGADGRAEMCLKRKLKSLVAGEGGLNICDISQVNPHSGYLLPTLPSNGWPVKQPSSSHHLSQTTIQIIHVSPMILPALLATLTVSTRIAHHSIAHAGLQWWWTLGSSSRGFSLLPHQGASILSKMQECTFAQL